MTIPVQFYSYFKDLTGTSGAEVKLTEGANVDDLLKAIYARYPKLTALSNSTLIAVGVEYQGKSYQLKPGDEVSLFPPVQGG